MCYITTFSQPDREMIDILHTVPYLVQYVHSDMIEPWNAERKKYFF